MKERIQAIVQQCLREYAEDADLPALAEASGDEPLYGPGSPLDSIGLVNLIADVEERVSEKFDREIILADERAMSPRNSPFRTVNSFVAYIEAQLAPPQA